MRARHLALPRLAVPVALSILSYLSLRGVLAAPGGVANAKLEASVRSVIEEHCGKCHDGSRATANPAALRVFDLRVEDWTRSLSEDQLRKVTGRTNGLDLPAEQKREIASFINLKLSERLSSARRNSPPKATKPSQVPAR